MTGILDEVFGPAGGAGGPAEDRRRAGAGGRPDDADVTPDVTPDVTVSRTDTAVTRESDSRDGSDTPLGDPDEDAELLADVRDGAWLDAQEFPPLRWAVPGLLAEGLCLLVGPPKAGKSWMLGNVLLAVAAGGRALGKLAVGPPRRVLYLALEDGDRRMQARCRAIVEGGPIPGLFAYKVTVPPGQVLAVIAAWMRRYPDTAMVVLDTLGRVMPPAAQGESSYQRDYRVGAALKRIADATPGLALVIVHHDRKAAAEDFVDSVSGTNGLAGSADTIIVLARRRGADDAVLKITGRDVPEAEYAVRLIDGIRWVLDGENLAEAAANAQRRADVEAISDTSVRIIDFIRGRPQRQVTAGQVTAEFGDGARKYLARHVEAGRLVKLARGRYAVPATPVSQPSRVSQPQVNGDADVIPFGRGVTSDPEDGPA